MARPAPILFAPILFAAPHRLAFLAGSLGLATMALWWPMQLAALHFGWPKLPAGSLPAALLHAPALLLQIYPAFIFGFLLTVFPRWMGQPDLIARQFGPVSGGLAIGMTVSAISLWTGADTPVRIGFLICAAAWAIGLVVLGAVVRANRRSGKPPCWHAVGSRSADDRPWRPVAGLRVPDRWRSPPAALGQCAGPERFHPASFPDRCAPHGAVFRRQRCKGISVLAA